MLYLLENKISSNLFMYVFANKIIFSLIIPYTNNAFVLTLQTSSPDDPSQQDRSMEHIIQILSLVDVDCITQPYLYFRDHQVNKKNLSIFKMETESVYDCQTILCGIYLIFKHFNTSVNYIRASLIENQLSLVFAPQFLNAYFQNIYWLKCCQQIRFV